MSWLTSALTNNVIATFLKIQRKIKKKKRYLDIDFLLSLKIFNCARKPYYVTLGVTVIFTTPFCQTVEDEGVLENSASGLSKTDLDL